MRRLHTVGWILCLLMVQFGCAKKDDGIIRKVVEIEESADGTLVDVEGLVTSNPGIYDGFLSDKGFGFWQKSGGIYVQDDVLKKIKKGDKVRVEGKTGTFFGMRIIKPIKVTPLKKDNDNVEKLKIIHLVAEQINDYYIGRVVRVTGKIESVQSDLPFGWRIQIRSEEHKSAQIMIASTVDVDPRRDKTIKKGNHFNVTGLLIKFKGEFLVMPRDLKDFEPVKPTL